tara:strand:- start:4009 stop:5709 length:1701 start_codon:yes stop_codon:yes gene_type:complete
LEDNILDVRNLNISFSNYGKNSQVLRDVNINVSRGERVSLIGQSGSGKTVTMRAIIGTLPTPPAIIESGEILYENQNLLALNRIERNKIKGSGISIILQDPLLSFNPVLTILRQMEDIVKYADVRIGISRGHEERKKLITETLRKVQLSDHERILNSYPIMLSGGMRQRVLIGMSLLNNPKLLIADEPGTALDVTTQKEILDLLNSLVKDEGLSLLFITHNLGVVREMADRIYVMQNGKIVETNSRENIFKKPKHQYTIKLMESVPPLFGDKVIDVKNTNSEVDEIISVSNLNKSFPIRTGFFNRITSQNHAVKSVNLTINSGDIYGIAGESGSGKTTIAKILLGLYGATSGTIKIDKLNLDEQVVLKSYRKLIQIVYQNPGSSLNRKRTVSQILSVPLKFSGYSNQMIKDRVNELLQMVDLPASYSSMYPHELSGGQKQRVAIARALSLEPKIIVLDEPTSALDVLIQGTVINLLHRLKKQLGLTYIFISHDLSLMRNFCNKIAIMFKGEICEAGNTKDIFSNPQHLYTKALISSIPVISDKEENLKPKVTEEERNMVLQNTRNI